MRPGRSLFGTPLAAALAAGTGLLLLGAASAEEAGASGASSGVDLALVPELARESIALITELSAEQCPELPPLWVVAQVEAESGWDPGAVTGSGRSTAAGLFQFAEPTWLTAGGAPWPSDPAAGGADVVDAEQHLRVAVPWMCATLRAVGGHLEQTGKPTEPLDAMLVCHIAGCGRVTGSATGIPQAGEAGCGERCAGIVARYLDTVHRHVERFAAAEPDTGPGATAAPAAWTGGATGCEADDPTGDGCLTGATLHGLGAIGAAFGGITDGPVILSSGCWSDHSWNPRSDHPRGMACDLFPTRAGTFPKGDQLAAGWRIAEWLREHAEPLRVKYLIWQGRYWDPGVAERDGGWGRRYGGGGVYDVRDATGGHYDHIHVSFRE